MQNISEKFHRHFDSKTKYHQYLQIHVDKKDIYVGGISINILQTKLDYW